MWGYLRITLQAQAQRTTDYCQEAGWGGVGIGSFSAKT